VDYNTPYKYIYKMSDASILPDHSEGGCAAYNLLMSLNVDFPLNFLRRRTVKRNLYLLWSLVVLASMILAACGGTVPATQPPAPGEPASTEPATEPPAATEPAATRGIAVLTFVQQPTTLNPLYANQWFSTITTQFWLKGLWSFDQNNNPVPEIAAEVPTPENGGMSEDGLTLTIKLRDDVTWSDGEPVTADDFVFTYEMYMAESNIVATRYPYEDYVSSVEAADDHTVVVNFTEPFAGWLTLLFQYGVLPEHVLRPVFEAEGTLDTA
jgi:peptide/nickel transport system substrate-binding protein